MTLQPNYAKLEPTILSMRNGLTKNRIIVTKNCRQTISDIETFRYSKNSVLDGNPRPITRNDGFAGCLRVVIGANKGEDAMFY